MRKNVLILMASAVLMLTSCWDKAEYVELVKLGVCIEKDVDNDYKILDLPSYEYGEAKIAIISNVDYDLQIVDEQEWLHVDQADMDTIYVSYPSNNGFARSAKMVLSYGHRVDTLCVRQPGRYSMTISLAETEILVPAEGGDYAVDVLTNVQTRDLAFEVSNSKVVKNVELSDNRLKFVVPPATSRDTKVYTVTVYAVDGWGERVECVLNLKQQSK